MSVDITNDKYNILTVDQLKKKLLDYGIRMGPMTEQRQLVDLLRKVDTYTISGDEYEEYNRLKYFEKNNGYAYIDCPFSEKEKAKQMGAKFDLEKKKWYVPRGLSVQPFFEKWKTYCRVCNGPIVCNSAKRSQTCEYTEAGLCCLYDYTSCGKHCDLGEKDYYGWYTEQSYFFQKTDFWKKR